MIVADVNLLSYMLFESTRTASARKVLAKDPVWIVPILWRYEFSNFLVRMVHAHPRSQGECLSAWQRAFDLLEPWERPVAMDRALQIAFDHHVTAYDAQYIALAKTHGLYCVTEDGELLKKFPETALSIEDFINGDDIPVVREAGVGYGKRRRKR